MLIEHKEKIHELKGLLEREMPQITVRVMQTDLDFDKRLVSFLFSKRETGTGGWAWCLKISGLVLAEKNAAQIARLLETSQWKERLQAAPDGSVFILTEGGLEQPTA